MRLKAVLGIDHVVKSFEGVYGKQHVTKINDTPENDMTLLEFRKILRDVRDARDKARTAREHAASAVAELNGLSDRVKDLVKWREEELNIQHPESSEEEEWEGA